MRFLPWAFGLTAPIKLSKVSNQFCWAVTTNICGSRERAESDEGDDIVIKSGPANAAKKPALQKMEASPGIEPGYADLQSATSPLRHEAFGTQ